MADFAVAPCRPRAPRASTRAASSRATLLRGSAALGLMGITVAREWGGAGRDYVSYALAVEAVARASAVVAVIAAVNNSLVAEPIAEFGSAVQKETLAAAAGIGRVDRRVRAVRGAGRVGRRQPADHRGRTTATAT